MRTVHFIGGPLDKQTRAVESNCRIFPAVTVRPDDIPDAADGRWVPAQFHNYQICPVAHGAQVHHVATLPGSPDPIVQLLAAYFKEN